MLEFALFCLHLLLSVLAAGHALLHKRDSKSALGWVACCLLVPYVGVFLYLLFGINRSFQSARRLRPATSGIRTVFQQGSPMNARYPMSVIGLNITHEDLLPVDDLQVLFNGDEAYPQMLQAIESASSTVHFSTYIFNRGTITKKFIKALSDAQARGVTVRIILDGLGELYSFPRIGRELAKAGLSFLRFNPLTLLPLSIHLNVRNHRKLLIVDSQTSFTGGINIADDNCLTPGKDHAQIQDVHFRLTGPIVCALENCFLQDWHFAFREKRNQQDAGPVPCVIPATQPGKENPTFGRTILDGPNEDIDKFTDTLIGTFALARKRIWIMTPYFLPDAEITGALQSACLRNLDVCVILPAENNIEVAHKAGRHQLWQLLNYGVRLIYQAPPFNHGKLILVDDDYTIVGSANIDPRSLRLNFEINVELFGTEPNAELSAYCAQKIEGGTVYTRRDLRQRNLITRLTDAVCWLFSPYL